MENNLELHNEGIFSCYLLWLITLQHEREPKISFKVTLQAITLHDNTGVFSSKSVENTTFYCPVTDTLPKILSNNP